ncbi:MAG: peptide ABC transporter substrate-binding protein [Chloroflexota bacterium]|nr:peptide ABC transporter substrate-binding protein [Chloroflexota bacterium]
MGLFAAWTVTPGPDEEALARPQGSDVVLAGGTPLSWDPAAIADGASAQVLTQVYEGLTVLDAGSQVRPALAQSWRVEEDGRRLVFELREGLTFSDGAPISAEDVKRSWLRVIDPTAPSPLSSLLDDIAGAAAYARGEGSVEAVGLEADGRTLTVDFERPAAYFPAVAAVPSLAVVPARIDESAAGPRAGTAFVASGPYVPVDQGLGEIRLEGNAAYWAGPPPIDRVTVLTDDGGRSNVDVFEDDTVDWTRISPADAGWIRYDRNLGPQLRHTEEMSVSFLGFDTTEPPFDDPAVRRAVAMGVDWRRLALLDGDDDPPPTSIVPPGIASRGSGDYLLPYDPDAARAELVTAGYPGGAGFPAVSLATYGVGQAGAVAAELERELGIEVNVERRPFEEHSMLLDRDTPDMWTLSWSADYPHAHDFLGLLLRSDSSVNMGGWSDAGYDALIDAAAATADVAEQERLYDEAQAIVREGAPVIPLDYGSSWWLSREDLQGGTISGVGLLRYADLAWAD